MKKKILFVFVISLLLFFIWKCFGIYNININYYTCVEANGIGDSYWWEVIRSKEELISYNKYIDLDLEKIENVDFNKNAIIISNGRKINKIVYRKSSNFFPFIIYNYSGIAYLQNEFNKNTVFVYLIDIDKKLFVDRHFDEEAQYIIGK